MTIENPTMAGYEFLAEMYADDYFPDALVAKGEAILRELCERIEAERPADLPALYALSREATVRFNDLQEELLAAGSDIETAAREWIAEDFGAIADAYGFTDADLEKLISPRHW